MEFLSEYGLFFAKTLTFVIAIAAIIMLIIAAGMKNQGSDKGQLEVTKINQRFEDLNNAMKSIVMDEAAFKAEMKAEEKQRKKEQKAKKKEKSPPQEEGAKKRLFVADFDGDIKASATEELREVVTAILSIADEKDEVVLRLESSGGMVHSYGLAASQLRRITSRNIPLTVCVDKVAASGGYMMACVAHKIVSAPFAIIGSIGVVAQLPNFHRLLKKHDIDYEMLTAGEYKRTLTMFGENTDKGREKFVEDLEDTHTLFKDFIAENREIVDVDAVSTGEIWFGTRALEEKLVDQLDTSDQYLFDRKNDSDIFEVKYTQKKSLAERMGIHVEHAIERSVLGIFQKLNLRYFT